jgi:hypothetical protein
MAFEWFALGFSLFSVGYSLYAVLKLSALSDELRRYADSLKQKA